MFGPLSINKMLTFETKIELETEEQQADLGSSEVGCFGSKCVKCECVNLVKLNEMCFLKIAHFTNDVPSK